MISKEKIYKGIMYLMIVVSFLLLIRSCEYEKQYQQVSNALKSADLLNQKFETELNEKGEQIATQRQVILTQQQALESNLITIEELKKYKNIKTKVQIETQTKIDTVFIPYADADSTLIELPDFSRKFAYNEKDDWFKIYGEANNYGIKLDTMVIRNDYSLLIADRKMGLFKKAEPEISLTNHNPYTETISLNNVQVKYKKPFYKKEWFWYTLGFVTKTLMSK